MAKNSLAGLLGANDMTVLALNQEVTKLLGTTGIVPPDIVASQMGMNMGMGMPMGMGGTMAPMMAGGMGGGMAGVAGMMMGASALPGAMYASQTMPMIRGSMMGGSMMGMPMGGTVVPQQLMSSNAITPMGMAGSLVTPFGGGMGLSIRW